MSLSQSGYYKSFLKASFSFYSSQRHKLYFSETFEKEKNIGRFKHLARIHQTPKHVYELFNTMKKCLFLLNYLMSIEHNLVWCSFHVNLLRIISVLHNLFLLCHYFIYILMGLQYNVPSSHRVYFLNVYLIRCILATHTQVNTINYFYILGSIINIYIHLLWLFNIAHSHCIRFKCNTIK